MNNIIRCDFRRTERRKEMREIEQRLQEILKLVMSSDEAANDKELSLEAFQLDMKYAQLEKEEKEWGNLKWGK